METQTVPWWKTDLGGPEIESVAAAIRGRHINGGPVCRELEARLAARLGVPHVTVTGSGSAALLAAIKACGVAAGDEVVIPALGFVAPAHAALLAGATVRLADVRADRPLVDPAAVAAAVTPRTKAIVAIHLGGAACDIDTIKSIAAPRGIAVIEDAAQAFASAGPSGPLGTLADAGAFSMGITKLITSGEGGFVATADDRRHEQALRFRNHGTLAIADNVFPQPGFNLRLTDMQAALVLPQLDRLDERIAGVTRVYEFYRRELKDLHYLRLIESNIAGGEAPLWTQVLCADRPRVMTLLAEQGIQTRPFHPPLSLSPHLQCPGDFPRAAFWSDAGLILPSGPDQPPQNLERTVGALRRIATAITAKAPYALR
ncbi:MAG: DegT/DnrJ/EryC1/StrS family aminotransferase [Planctomycetaceae bacterium]|nr:DegT/DnrJ/EryC1/StrS family aminotransferase [Planctomycetaceae bacterium]